MIRRRSLYVVAAWLATLTGTGCQDDAIPTAVLLKAPPRGPSYFMLTSDDVTYPVPHGTFRIYDQQLLDATGKDISATNALVPNAPIRFTGKWQIGPITNVDDDCPLCDYALYLAGGPFVHGLVVTRSSAPNPEPGASGTFDWSTSVPNESGLSFSVRAAFSMGSTFGEPTDGVDGWDTTCPTCGPRASYFFGVAGPTFEPVVTGPQGSNGWYTGDVSVSWSITEGSTPATAKDGCDPSTVTTDTNGWTSTCSVTSRRGTGVRSVTIKRDATQPTLTATISPNPVVWNGSATASPNATDEGSGIDSQSCGALNTSVIGRFSVPCTATDKAGNTMITSVEYVVTSPYKFGGFGSPIDPAPTVNTAKAGAAIPVKFSLGGNYGLAIFAAGYPKWQQVVCSASPNDNPVDEVTAAATGNGLTYDAPTDQYTYVWKSDKAWAGMCGDLMIKLADGSVYSARFQFKK